MANYTKYARTVYNEETSLTVKTYSLFVIKIDWIEYTCVNINSREIL